MVALIETRLGRAGAVALGLALATCAWGTTRWPPQRFTVTYDLRAMGTVYGHTRWSLEPAGDGRYVYQSLSHAVGLATLVRDETIVERSEWSLAGDGLRSLSYSYDRRGGRNEKTVKVAFDWDRGMVRNTARGSTWQMPIPEGTLDKLNYVLVLMRDLGRGEERLTYRVADGGKLKDYRFERLGEETLDTALGKFVTVKLRRDRGPDAVRETVLWCAPALGFVPVRARHVERDGTVVVWSISGAEGL